MELILGGTFSGKSDFACERARVAAGTVWTVTAGIATRIK